ncbi:tetrathionate reductase family octaheme c-type cytochrome [Roseovarius ramblicola]|uniref:Tetrathionate reductase family octaheme c-type cytochrome n=1 Tax=Roseovarius ramblicola TaxID=2022336 RepID=A0ABV5I2M3_9RHOB
MTNAISNSLRTLGLITAFFGFAVSAYAQMQESDTTADHSKFEELEGPFASGPEVTRACLSCHTEAAEQFQDSIHWTWQYEHPETGQLLGKRHVINAFCGNVVTNERRCTSCHAGYGWEDTETFDFTAQDKVDCLVCHDTTGTYAKWPDKAGHPIYEPVDRVSALSPYAAELLQENVDGTITHMPPDLAKVAQNVGTPGRENCGSCHFYGGGGDNVKHGDLSSALATPDPHVDVHMSPDGANMVCTDCHTAQGHAWPGSRYLGTVKDNSVQMPGFRRPDVLSCQSCHSDEPHAMASLMGLKLNDHTDRVACQTCHIPEFAKGGVATKTWWDWSTAGQLRDGRPFSLEDEETGRHSYLSTKGDFEWGMDVVPTYEFWNGVVEYTLLGEKIDPNGMVGINRIHGGANDPGSVIYPFKRMSGRQAYDEINEYLLLNNVYGPEGDTALWTNFNWEKALAAGMEATDIPYSGKYAFTDTEMWWPTTHMVAPAAEALDCQSCHARDGRLANLAGLYIPGRDGFALTDRIGLILLALSLAGVLGHAAIRVVAARRK